MLAHYGTFMFWTAVCLSASSALGHVPVFSDGSAVSPETAIRVEDVTVSRVVYHELTDGTEQLWVTFDGTAGQVVPFRLGVPLIDRLSDFRPALAILGPGLSPVDLPFDVPATCGERQTGGPDDTAGACGVVIQADPGQMLEVFEEHFTGTDSWIVGDLELTLPQDGQYYAVAYVPAGETGKLWVAMGDREVFGPEDIANFGAIVNRVRAFHEVPQSPVPCFVPLFGAVALTGMMLRLLKGRRPESHSKGRLSCTSSWTD